MDALQQLHDAVKSGADSLVRELLHDNPTLDVNWLDKLSQTFLHHACCNGHHVTISLLLAHPGIEPNRRNGNGDTPFALSCVNGRPACVEVLLHDSRVDINESGGSKSPLRWAASSGHLDIIKWMIASGRELDIRPSGPDSVDPIKEVKSPKKEAWETDAVFDARKKRLGPVAEWLQRFKEKPTLAKDEARRDLGISCKLFS